MSVAEDIENGLRELQRSQADRAWAAAGAFVTTVGFVFAMAIAMPLFQTAELPNILLATLIAVGATWGTASLYFFSFVKSLQNRALPFFRLGLWSCVLTASGFIYAGPILFVLAIVPCLSAWALTRRISMRIASTFVILPVVSACMSLLLGRSFWGPS